ncbi:MAG: hypothetical protein GY803_05970, partial [Chloroflexi bacterium]|nr:hypothetical protein [Chloroflexota bacterium]
FRLQFRTENYALGMHTMSARGYASDGRILQSNIIQRQFVAGSDSTKAWIIIPIIILAVGGRMLTSWIADRNRTGKGPPLISGPFGGTICPKCDRPFAMHVWGLNVVMGKYDRCPHCGQWSLVRRVSPDALQNAAAAFADDEETAVSPPPSDDNSFRQQLDDSRFDSN